MSSLPPPPPPPPPASGQGSGQGSGHGADHGGITTCYRHSNRPAFRRCTRCERFACDDCLVPGSIGSLCPECAKAGRPPAAVRAKQWNATRGSTLGTSALIVINVAVGLYTMTSRRISGTLHQGEYDLAVNRYFVDKGEWWRLITAGFTHFGAAHLIMNMVSLYFLGRFVEPAIGRTKFFALYFASLLAGTAGALMLQPHYGLTAGASGAIFGLLGASAVGMRQRGIPLMQSSIGTMILLNLIITFTISGVSIGGHLGGLVGGAICGSVLLAPRQRKVPTWAMWLVPIAVIAASVLLAFVVSHDITNSIR